MRNLIHEKEGLVDIKNTLESEAEDKEREIKEIINELNKLDTSQLPFVLDSVRKLRLREVEDHESDG